MKISALIFVIMIPMFGQSQDKQYSGTTVKVSPFYNQIIESNYYESGEDYYAAPYESLLYNLPLNCDSVIQLKPCNNFDWFSKERYIYGENIDKRKVYLFTQKGIIFKTLENAELFAYHGGNKAIFIREYLTWNESDRINPQVILYDFENDEEIILYEFDKVKYTFHNPVDEDGPGLPKNFDYYYGGIRGTLSSTDGNIEHGYTFVIDIKQKKLKFWLDRKWTDTDIRKPVPEEGKIKNGN